MKAFTKKFICECKSVYKSEIIKTIRDKGAENISQIQMLTRASTGCGRCKPLISHILNVELRKRKVEHQQLCINFEKTKPDDSQ